MPLLIDSALVDLSQNFHPSEIFASFPALCEGSKSFRSSLEKVELNGNNERVLYVHQHEIATISPQFNAQNFRYIASDDATTCHLVVLTEERTGAISLGHFDGGRTEEGMEQMFSEMLDIQEIQEHRKFNLHLFGGFVDDKQYSEKLFSEIISYCACSPYEVTLQVAYCYSLNDIVKNGQHACDLYGVAVEISSKKFFIAACTHHGPDSVLRYTRMSSVETFSSLYDFRKQVLYVDPFTFRKQRWTSELLALDDATYLRYCSTSPHCEPEHFVRDSKASLLFCKKWEKRVSELFCGERREYVLDNENRWNLVNPNQLKV